MGIPASPSKVSLSLPLPLPPSSLPPSLFLSWGERRAHPSGSRLQGDGKGERERERGARRRSIDFGPERAQGLVKVI